MDNSLVFYQQRLNLQGATLSRIEHEDAIVAIVYKVTQPNGIELILKICERLNDYLRELYFLSYFSGKLLVPRVIKVVEPEANIHGALLMEYLPGRLLKKTDLTDDLAYQVGSLLARIHLNHTPGYGDLIQPKSLTSNPHIHFTSKFEESLDECRHHLPQAMIDQCHSYYNARLNLLDSVDGPCMIHRDFRPGNVVINKGKLQGIIDWSSGRASFAEEDFCPLENGAWSSNANINASFLTGYASIRPVPHYKELMPFLKLSRTIAIIGFTVKQETWKSSCTHLYEVNRHFLNTFFKQEDPPSK